ncbi:NAD(P)/FAD-dependent oxidoreductase [Priestia megaterium]|uniref:NAD(P)/FAD-dependent oxidoreductase n=1 Tax=Priestia megaterium TaxID=1404 RepID=UPI0032D8FB0A
MQHVHILIIGGGDRAFEDAHLLATKAKEVYLIHRSTHFKTREQYVDKVLSNPGVKVMTDTEVTAIHGKHHVTSIDLKSKNSKYENLLVDAVLIRLGVAPNVELIKEKVTTTQSGLIVINEVHQSSNASIYTIGDACTTPLFSSISSSAGQGAIVAKHLSSLLTIYLTVC